MGESYFNSINTLTIKFINENISTEYVAFKDENLPNKRGIYFIYRKESEIENKLVYIGCAYKQSRNIKKRCGQNLDPSDTGGTFRDKVMREELEDEPYEIIVDEKGKKKKGKIIKEKTEKGIKHIKEKFVLKFIEVGEKMTENEVLLLERACINYYQPHYNKA